MEGGEPDRELEMRRDFQRTMKEHYTEMIEQLTGRSVLAFLSQARVERDITIEIFLMDRPLAGFGALELVNPPPANPGSDDN
ncbi:MAG: Na-translocating system protein MpsC family protein [Solirubrobacteraceae bacterium]